MNRENQTVLLKSGNPISVLLLGVLIILFGGIAVAEKLAMLIYLIPFGLIYYYIFCRFSGSILLTNDEITFNYLMPWLKQKAVRLEDIKDLDYGRGFYNFFSDKAMGGVYAGLQYCYDTLIITTKGSSVLVIKINTRTNGFTKLLKELERLKIHFEAMQ